MDEFATKRDLYEVFGEATETILQGVQKMFDEQNKINDEKFATKEDLKSEIASVRNEMATKEDLKREVGWIRDDINGLKADLVDVPTREEFNKLKQKGKDLTTS